MATTSAPATPAASNWGPKEPEVPWPPTRGMEPMHRPSRGSSKPNSWAKPTPTKFCIVIMTVASSRNTSTGPAPLRSTLKLAPYPTLVKNQIMNTFFRVSSKVRVSSPV